MPADPVKFGDDLEIDRASYELRRSGRPLKLERIPLEILFLLIERHGQLVAREEIIGRVWGKDVFLDTDTSINSAIRKIRQVLRDSPESPVFLQTVTGKGYRFIANVSEPVSADAQTFTEAAVATTPPKQVNSPADLSCIQSTERSGRWWKWTVAMATLLLLLAAGIFGVRGLHTRTAMAPQRVMLAVLPFANLSDDPEQEYFSDGLTEETITDLGELNPAQLGVIARTSSATYKHTGKTISQIGKELGVDYVLEGSVREEDGVARVSAQLIRVKDQVHLWAHNYDRETGGLLALQNELGQAIAQHVRVNLTYAYSNHPGNNYAPNADAYELYLKGRFSMNKRTWPEMLRSTEYFQHAIAKDPGFALAYAGLADSYLARSIGDPGQFDSKAKAAATRALELDDDIAEAHTALGTVKADFEYDWAGAEKEFARGIELNPNSPEAHSLYAWSYLTPLGEFDEAIVQMKKALEIDPFSRIDNTRFGLVYLYARRYDEAGQQFNKAVLLNPDFFVTYYHRAWFYSQLGQYQNAIADVTMGRRLAGPERLRRRAANQFSKDGPLGFNDRFKYAASDEVDLRRAYAKDGPDGFWNQLLIQQANDPEIGEFAVPQIYARLRNNEKALAALQRNYEERAALATLVKVDPAFDSLRSDSRFVDLVRRMGLSPDPKTQR